ncbi:MAG: reverse transcriptase/maturase family protein [Patescibacteria group bacterium]
MREKIRLVHTFDEIICLENLLSAWREFIRGKRHRRDVQKFESRLMDNLISLHDDLANGDYRHGGYEAFNICDPKPRNIHKASVRDRLVHHAVHRILYPFFDRTFMADSYSCRLNKGTHKAIDRFRKFAYVESKNNTRTCWILKGDIRKFFASIDHGVLKGILAGYIPDKKILDLLGKIIDSFHSKPGIGLPLGNLTSQLLANIHLNEFDQFIKHKLKVEYYIRYADDFVIMSPDRDQLQNLIIPIENFLKNELKLTLHPDKVYIKTLASGVDFLGWVNFFDHRVIRTKTKRRLLTRIASHPTKETVSSYLGLLKHGNTFKIREKAMETPV